MARPNEVFSATKINSVMCAKFQGISLEFSNFQNSGTKKNVVNSLNHNSNIDTCVQCIITDPNLVFLLKPSDSVTCGKFEMISMQYDDFPNQQRYHWEGPWKL